MTTGPGHLQMALKKKDETERREEMKETERREGKTAKNQEVGQIDLAVHHRNRRHLNHPGQRIPHHYPP